MQITRNFARCVLLFCVLFILPKFALADEISYNLDYSLDKLHVTAQTYDTGFISRVYDVVSYDGYDYCGEASAPMIPCKYVRFAVPYNATNISISCVRYGYPSIVNLDNSVYPVQQDFDGNTTEDQVYFTLPMSNYYFTPVGYPFERAWLVDDGFYHGCNRIITVAMCPFTYYGHLNRLEIARYNVTISYSTNSVAQVPASGGIVNLSDEIARVDTSLINREMNLLKGFVANPEQVESFAHGITPYAYPYPDIDNDPGG